MQWFNTDISTKTFTEKHKLLPVWQWKQETPMGLWAPNLINTSIHTTINESDTPVALVQKSKNTHQYRRMSLSEDIHGNRTFLGHHYFIANDLYKDIFKTTKFLVISSPCCLLVKSTKNTIFHNASRRTRNTNEYSYVISINRGMVLVGTKFSVAVTTVILHDDVIKWKHFPGYRPLVRGIHRRPVNSPHKGQWRGALLFSLICAWIKGWVNNGDADFRRHRAHYDVIVIWQLQMRSNDGRWLQEHRVLRITSGTVAYSVKLHIVGCCRNATQYITIMHTAL